MAFLRFTRDPRGYEHFYLVEPTTNRRGKSRSRVLYFFRTPPNVKVGREPFDDSVRRALEARYPEVEFDWRRILETPIPSADAEKWRERRRQEKAEKAARRAARGEAGSGELVSDTADLVSDTATSRPDIVASAPDAQQLAIAADAAVSDTGELVSDTGDAEDEERPPHAIEAAIERTGGGEIAEVTAPRKRRRHRRGRHGRPAGTDPGTQTGTDPGTQTGTDPGTDPDTSADRTSDDSADESEGD